MTQLIEQGLAWMLHRLCVEVEEWPAEGEEVVVLTWPTGFTGAAAERAFRLTDSAGRQIARAASRWAVVDLRARRAVRLPETMRRLPVGEAPALALGAAPELPQDAPAVGEVQLRVGRADLDRLGHANNTRYLEWALEAVPDAWAEGRELCAFDVVFRRESRRADPVRSRAVQLDRLRLGHELALPDERVILATLETRWRQG
jgi:medium-chain acyl-[acyl-carrier-protein] hydrolase